MTVYVPSFAGAVHVTASPVCGASVPSPVDQAGVSNSPLGRESVRLPVSETCWTAVQTSAPPPCVETSLIVTPPRPWRWARSRRNAALNALAIHTVRVPPRPGYLNVTDRALSSHFSPLAFSLAARFWAMSWTFAPGVMSPADFTDTMLARASASSSERVRTPSPPRSTLSALMLSSTLVRSTLSVM